MDVSSIELVHGRGVGVHGAYAFKQFASEVDATREAHLLLLAGADVAVHVRACFVAARNGLCTIAMERGVDLRDACKPLDAATRRPLLRAWTECVGALHARHMAQLDVKPDNAVVLGGGDGVRVRLVDFGHAARTDADGRATVTVPTMTHGYRPPSIAALCFEHRRGEQHTVDARAADTHALGVSLRELDGDGDGTLLYALAGRLLEDSAEPLSIDALLAVQQAWSPIARATTQSRLVPKAGCDV